MKQTTADIADKTLKPDLVVVTTNGCLTHTGLLVMGAGVALKFKRSYPGIDAILGTWVQERGNVPCLITKWAPHIISLPTKNHWQDPSPIDLVESSLRRLMDIVDYHGYQRIVMPRVGCGLGGLSWEKDVRPLCIRYLDDRFTVVAPAPVKIDPY
jgi:O-acetyl-ADP-ribose deacetylase (regulator of RNase III)